MQISEGVVKELKDSAKELKEDGKG